MTRFKINKDIKKFFIKYKEKDIMQLKKKEKRIIFIV